MPGVGADSSVVSKLPPRQAGAAAALLARAFADDPVLGHFLTPGWRRRFAYPGFFRLTIESALPSGYVYRIGSADRMTGVAVWFPPRRPDRMGRAGQVRAAASLLPVRALYPVNARTMMRGFPNFRSYHPAEPHWYLSFVGIEPSAQSQGLGARLLAPVLDEAETTGVACYLETPFLRTHLFYERLGFHRCDEIRPFPTAPPLTTFLRPAP